MCVRCRQNGHLMSIIWIFKTCLEACHEKGQTKQIDPYPTMKFGNNNSSHKMFPSLLRHVGFPLKKLHWIEKEYHNQHISLY